jgi:L-asparaginase
MKKIAVIFNGGTIAMKIDDKIKAAVPALTGEEIMSMVTGISEKANIELHTFSNVPSPHMTPENMLELSKYVKNLVGDENIDGVVVTHGTDSLEETAYLLDLTIKSQKPIVITGSMRSGSELGYDGPSNLAASICTAISEKAVGKGVLVCFNGELNSASEVTKINSMSLNAFGTPTFGPIGIVDNNEVLFYREIFDKEIMDVNSINAKVDLIKCVAGQNSEFIDFCIDKGADGIVIEAMGRGNIPPDMVEGVKRAIQKNICIVIVSRCFEGRVFTSYGYKGGGKQLKELGVILGDNMPGQKARIKLILALSTTKEHEKIKEIFEKGLYKM